MYGQLAGCDSLNGIVDAAHHDSVWAGTLCAGLKDEITQKPRFQSVLC